MDQSCQGPSRFHQKTAQKPTAETVAAKTDEQRQPITSQKSDAQTKTHQVRAGETLYRISRQYGISVEQLRRYNNLAADAAIYPGQKLKLSPNAKE